MITGNDVSRCFNSETSTVRIKALTKAGFDFNSNLYDRDHACNLIAEQINALADDELSVRTFLILTNPKVTPGSPAYRIMKMACQKRGLDP